MNLSRIIPFLLFAVSMANCSRSGEAIRLSDIEFGEIIAPYGAPKRNRSYTNEPIHLKDSVFAHGLGGHAPANWCINLQGKAACFEAWIGIDQGIKKRWNAESRDKIRGYADYVYDNREDHYDFTSGGTASFEIYGDDQLLYESGTLSIGNDPLEVKINLKGVNELKLITNPGEDGNYADHVNWAAATLYFRNVVPENIKITSIPGKVLVNHAGYHPEAFKFCYRYRADDTEFALVDAQDGSVVFRDHFTEARDGRGDYSAGNLSNYKKPGTYYLSSGSLRSDTFRIGEENYLECIDKHLQYLKLQRSGHPTMGWAPGNHLDDGVRDDNGRHQDVTGGWYDACDLRKPAEGNTYLLYSLAHLLELSVKGIPEEQVIDEIKWGNKFLFAMQEPEGYLMHYIGSTWKGYHDNRWTDNIIGNKDDRTIITEAAEIDVNWLFIIAESMIAKEMIDKDPDYARRCRSAAINCYEWAKEQDVDRSVDYGLGTSAAMKLFILTQDNKYLADAERFLNILLEMQIRTGFPTAHFYDHSHPYPKEGTWIMDAFLDYLSTTPEGKLAKEVGTALSEYLDSYVKPLSCSNAFNIMPWNVRTDSLPYSKNLGDLWCRNFLHVGCNRHLAKDGKAFLRSGQALDQKEWIALAQKQIDWIYGANPLNASTVTDIGHNQPSLFKTGAKEFRPPTPSLTGGVMTGIGGDYMDYPVTYPGWWWTTEYWSPTFAYTLILVSSLQEHYSQQ